MTEEVAEVEESQTGADASPVADAEIDVNDLAAVEAKSREDAEEEVAEPESEAESPPAEEEDLEEKTNPFQERIDKLTQRWRDTERSLTQLEQENEELRRKVTEIPQSKPEVKTLADFEYDEGKFQAYVYEQAQEQAREAARRELEGFSAKDRATQAQVKFKEVERDFAESVPDYREVVYDPNLRISGPMAEAIREAAMPELGYYLGKHPEVAADIADLSPAAAGIRMGELVADLKAEKAKVKPKLVSNAPPPPSKKVSGNEPGKKVSPTDPKSGEMSDAEWFAAEEKRQAKLRG